MNVKCVGAGSDRHFAGQRQQRGVALAIVVWFIAGMSLLVAGVVSRAAIDTRMAQLHVARAEVSAAGDGAIRLHLAALVSGGIRDEVLAGLQATPYRLGDLQVAVTLTPAAGLVDLNSATPQVLAALFSVAGGLEQPDAQLLAGNVVDWRQAVQRRAGNDDKPPSRFREVEDLMRVEGVNRRLLDSLRDYVAAGTVTMGGMDWAQASPAVLEILRQADGRKFAAVSRRRLRQMQAAAGAGQGSRPGQPRIAGAFRADAVVRYGDRTWLRRHWVTITSSGDSLLPWRVVRIELPRVAGS